MSNKFVKGAIIITIATMLSKIIGSVYRIPIQNIAGDGVFGIYSIVYPVYMSVLILTVAGIPLAISKLISEARVAGRKDEVYLIYRTATILGIIFGLISFSLMYLFSGQIAILLGGAFAKYSLMIVSVSLLFAPYMAVHRGFFQGFEDMKPTAISQVLEQLVRVAIILVMAYVLTMKGETDEVVSAGLMIGSIIGVIAALVYLQILFQKSKKNLMDKVQYTFSNFRLWSKRILIVAIPICIGALTMAFLNMVDSFTIPFQLASTGHEEEEVTHLFGIYSRGVALVQIAVVFASALILPLIPHITAAMTQGKIEETRGIIEKANKFTHLTSWPLAIGLVALTMPINLALFTNLEGNNVIAILSFSAVFTAFSVLTTGILQGMNRANHAAIIVIICAIMKIILNFVLVHKFGLVGGAVSTLITYIVLTILNLIMIYRTVPFTLVKREDVAITFSSVVMGVVVYIPLFFLNINDWNRLQALIFVTMMVIVGGIIYVFLVLLLKVFKNSELQGLPVVGKYFKK